MNVSVVPQCMVESYLKTVRFRLILHVFISFYLEFRNKGFVFLLLSRRVYIIITGGR